MPGLEKSKHRNFTLQDLAALGVADQEVIDIISMQRDILDRLHWKPCNKNDTTYETPVRAGYAHGKWVGIAEGIPSTAGRLVLVSDTCGRLASRSTPPVALIDGYEDGAKARYELDLEHEAGLSEDFADMFWYGNTNTNPKAFMGLTPRFDNIRAGNAKNIISDDMNTKKNCNASIWVIVEDDRVMHGIYPKKSKAGLDSKDLGIIQEDDPVNGGKYSAYCTEHEWRCGVTLKDWRNIVRVIFDVTNLNPDPENKGGPNLITSIQKALGRIYNHKLGPMSIYMNREIKEMVDLQAPNVKNLRYGFEQIGGEWVDTIRGVPKRTDETLLSTEEPLKDDPID